MKRLFTALCFLLPLTYAHAADYVYILADCTNGTYNNYTDEQEIAKKFCNGTYDCSMTVSGSNHSWQTGNCSLCAKCGAFDVYLPASDESHKMVLCMPNSNQGGICEKLTAGCHSGYKSTTPNISLSAYTVGSTVQFTNKAQWECCNSGECTGYGYSTPSNYASLGLSQRGIKTCSTTGTCGVGNYSVWLCSQGYYCTRTSSSGCFPSSNTNPNQLTTMCKKCSDYTGNPNATSDYPTTPGPYNCYIPAGTIESDETGTYTYTSNCYYTP